MFNDYPPTSLTGNESKGNLSVYLVPGSWKITPDEIEGEHKRQNIIWGLMI